MWKSLVACLLAFTMISGNSALIVNAEGDETEENTPAIVQEILPVEEGEPGAEDETEEMKNIEQEDVEEQEEKAVERPEKVEQGLTDSDNIQSIQSDNVLETDEVVEDKNMISMSDDEESPYWINMESDCAWGNWEEMYCGQKQTLTAELFDWRQSEDLRVPDAMFEWDLQEVSGEDVKAGVVEIVSNANKCTITAKTEGEAQIHVVAKQGGTEICDRTLYINVSKNLASYVFTIEEIYAHPGDVLSVNSFSPKLVKYENGKLIGTVVPQKLVFVAEPNDSIFASQFIYNSNGTLTVKDNPELRDIHEIFYSVGMEAYVSDSEESRFTAWNGASVHYTTGKWKTTKPATVYVQETQRIKCTICGKSEERTVGSKLKAMVKPNVSSVILKTKQSTKKFKVTLAAGDSVASWKSSNKKIVTVSGKANGICTIKAGKKTGTAKITIKTAAGATKTIKVKVQKKKVATSSIKQVPKKITIKKGKTYKLAPSIQPITSPDKVKYSSANKKVATVSGKGVIKGKKVGKSKITVKAGKKKVTCTVVVTK